MNPSPAGDPPGCPPGIGRPPPRCSGKPPNPPNGGPDGPPWFHAPGAIMPVRKSAPGGSGRAIGAGWLAKAGGPNAPGRKLGPGRSGWDTETGLVGPGRKPGP